MVSGSDSDVDTLAPLSFSPAVVETIHEIIKPRHDENKVTRRVIPRTLTLSWREVLAEDMEITNQCLLLE